MTQTISVSPIKAQFIAADGSNSEINDVVRAPRVELDPEGRTLKLSSEGREETGSIEGDLIASARGVKITCGGDDGVRRSLHLSFQQRAELDELLERLSAAGLKVVRALDEDPQVRTTEETPSVDKPSPAGGDTNEAADERATIVDPSDDQGKDTRTD